ncbi:MAG: hypothetical protein WCF22_21810, partial [Candidatus Sulfotelmatobacter sp.]
SSLAPCYGPSMKITWVLCRSYEEAQHYSRIIYLHEWGGKPFYWGKADRSFFGGHMRERDGLRASGRYNAGYRHWIEGCLRHGGKLYIGKLDEEALSRIDEVENYLIHTYGHEMNSRVVLPLGQLQLGHEGDIPQSITNSSAAFRNKVTSIGTGTTAGDEVTQQTKKAYR